MEKKERRGLWIKPKMQRLLFIISVSITMGLVSCKEDPGKITETKKNVIIPAANGDSIFSYVEKQLQFGYRVPGTKEHEACKDWLVDKLRSFGAEVTIQSFTGDFLDRRDVQGFNIIAQFNPNIKKRVLLAAHWDSRMIAEKDSDETKRDQPIAGADDGASGVASLLEIARLIQSNPIDLGIDIVFFDMEDQGVHNGDAETWCLGSQYWSKNTHYGRDKAKYGILLDMVGAKNASFGREGYSMQFASKYVNKIWKLAQTMGYSDLFVNVSFGGIMDDHYYVNRFAAIPMLDIVNYDLKNNKFGAYHHTQNDNIDIISKRTLRVVTQVVTAAIYKESGNNL